MEVFATFYPRHLWLKALGVNTPTGGGCAGGQRWQGPSRFYLSWINVIYSFCEYFEFARRLSSNATFEDGAVIEIEYRNMKGVGLSSREFDLRVIHHRPSTFNVIPISRRPSCAELASSSTELARDSVIQFLKCFELDVRPDVVEQAQLEFFSLRIQNDGQRPPEIAGR